MTGRETIYAALWTLITTASGIAGRFATLGRTLRHLEDVDLSQMPALYMIQDGELWERVGKGVPAKRTLLARLVFYVGAPQGTTAPATLLNNAMDAIDALFNNPEGRVETLGGRVERVYVAEGEVRFFEGLLQDKSPATVPIRILVP